MGYKKLNYIQRCKIQAFWNAVCTEQQIADEVGGLSKSSISRELSRKWYGSLDIKTALTEVAYYRLKFNQDSEAELGYVETLLTAFNVCVKTNQGMDLTQIPFIEHQADISSKMLYITSQLLGSDMRASHIEAFVFYSARTEHEAKKMGVYSMDVFSQKNGSYTYNQQTWKCVSSKEDVQIAGADGFGKHEEISCKRSHYH